MVLYLLNQLFFANLNELELIKNEGIDFTIDKEFDHFKITKINSKFLNKESRKNSLKKKYLIRLN